MLGHSAVNARIEKVKNSQWRYASGGPCQRGSQWDRVDCEHYAARTLVKPGHTLVNVNKGKCGYRDVNSGVNRSLTDPGEIMGGSSIRDISRLIVLLSTVYRRARREASESTSKHDELFRAISRRHEFRANAERARD